jgi:hypothetical protein
MSGWTPERRKRQAEAIRRWAPWASSTGPRSVKGKAIASRNAWKGGARPEVRAVLRLLREHRRAMADLITG